MYPSQDQPENIDWDAKIVEGENNQGSKKCIKDRELESGRLDTTKRSSKILVTSRNFALCNTNTNEYQSIS